MFTKEMQRALIADGEKLRQLTGQDHGPGAVPSLTLEEVAEKLDAILDKYQMPKFKPIGWSEADYERTADWVEPMRREIERIRELCLQATIDQASPESANSLNSK